MSSSNVNRRRNRWDSNTSEKNSAEAQVAASAAVSAVVPDDDAAIQALLDDAQARQAERERQDLENKSKKRRGDQVPNHRRKHVDTGASDGQGDGSYYGPSSSTDTKQACERSGLDDDEEAATIEKEKPNFGISGALAKDATAGNMYRGVQLKFQEPPEARAPNTLWRLYVYKGDELIETLHINRQSAYLLGRNTEIADVPLLHPSCSSQHAVIQFRATPNPSSGKLNTQPYIMDLESANGTLLNGILIDAARYYQLKKGDVLRFGASTREYVLLAADTKKI